MIRKLKTWWYNFTHQHPCDQKTCTYYTVYLRRGDDDLNHDQFHTVEQYYDAYKRRVDEYVDRGTLPPDETQKLYFLFKRQARA